jgi:hypothetical protein
MTNIDVINIILEALPKINEKSAEIYERGGLKAEVFEPNPEEVKLIEYLGSLPRERVLSVLTIMYYGRDGDPIPGLRAHLDFTFGKADEMASQMLGKQLALQEYFLRAIQNARRENIDLNEV